MELLDGPVQLPGHVDVPLGGQVALVPHQGLQGVTAQPQGVLLANARRKSWKPYKWHASVCSCFSWQGRSMTLSPLLVFRGLLNSGELDVQRPLVMRPGEHHRAKVNQLAQMLDDDGMEGNPLIPLPLVVLVPGDRRRLVQRNVVPTQGQRLVDPPTGHVQIDQKRPPPIGRRSIHPTAAALPHRKPRIWRRSAPE